MTREEERRIAATLGEGPLIMFDDGLPLMFLRGPKPKAEPTAPFTCVVELAATEMADTASFHNPHPTQEEKPMGRLSEVEDEWQKRATGEAVACARKVAKELQTGLLMPIGKLGDREWTIIVTAGISGWISVRTQQAIEENRDPEETTRLLDLNPTPQISVWCSQSCPSCSIKRKSIGRYR